MRLFQLTRDHHPEITIHGQIGLIHKEQLILYPDRDTPIVSRSLLKPWQFLATELNPSQDFWTMGLASHSGEEIQIQKLHELQEILGISTEDLFCPKSYPSDQKTAWTLRLKGAEKEKIYNPCFGKHLIYRYAHHRENNSVRYDDLTSPVHKRLDAKIHQITRGNHKWLRDSCGLPTLLTAMTHQLHLWQSLNADLPAFKQLRQIWLDHPVLIGGSSRLDTQIMQHVPGLLAKEGADGLLALQTTGNSPTTILVKLSHGFSPKHSGTALYVLLNQLQSDCPLLTQLLVFLKNQLGHWVNKDQRLVSCLPSS